MEEAAMEPDERNTKTATPRTPCVLPLMDSASDVLMDGLAVATVHPVE